MKKFKIVFIVLAVMVVALVIWLAIPKWVTANPARSKFPVKAADILPTMPVPKSQVLGQRTSVGTGLASAQIVFVPRVIDGDTIVVEPVDAVTGEAGRQETVRYIGMDTPETVSPTKPVECYGHEASARNKALVDGKYVAIAAGAGDKDKYGRLLRFVYLLDGTLVDLELVKEGYARVLTIPPNSEFEDEFKAAAAAAQASKLGFWGACPVYPFQ
jgi:micrococcal nuclease